MSFQFDKHITRYEVLNQCILLEDDKKQNYSTGIDVEKIWVLSEGKYFDATIREYFVNGKFIPGIAFHREEGHVSEFFFEISVAERKIAKLYYAENKPVHDGRPVVDIEIITKAIQH